MRNKGLYLRDLSYWGWQRQSVYRRGSCKEHKRDNSASIPRNSYQKDQIRRRAVLFSQIKSQRRSATCHQYSQCYCIRIEQDQMWRGQWRVLLKGIHLSQSFHLLVYSRGYPPHKGDSFGQCRIHHHRHWFQYQLHCSPRHCSIYLLAWWSRAVSSALLQGP